MALSYLPLQEELGDGGLDLAELHVRRDWVLALAGRIVLGLRRLVPFVVEVANTLHRLVAEAAALHLVPRVGHLSLFIIEGILCLLLLGPRRARATHACGEVCFSEH